MGGLCGLGQARVSEARLERFAHVWDKELNLTPEEASHILRGWDVLFGFGIVTLFQGDFCNLMVGSSNSVVLCRLHTATFAVSQSHECLSKLSLSLVLSPQHQIDANVCDWKRIDLDRLFVFASGEDNAINEAKWFRFCHNINCKQKKELGRLLFLIYSDDNGASVSIDTVISASQKAVGKYQHHVSEWDESRGNGHGADSDPLHKQICFELTGGKRYFNMEQFNKYVERHHHIGYGLVNMQRELRQLTGGSAMWMKISQQRVKDLLSNMSNSERDVMDKERKKRMEKEEKRRTKVKQKDTLMKRLRRI